MSSGRDLMARIANAGARMDPGLSGRDVERIVVGAGLRRQRRRMGRMALAIGATCASAVAILVMALHGHESPNAEHAAKQLAAPLQKPQLPAANPIVRLADGSTATALDPTTEISIAEDKDDRAELLLTRGRGRFDVKPRPSRTFVVHAGNVTITVLGTLFTVERVADRVGVAVERGNVRVDWGVGSAILEESSSGWYPPLVISGLDEHTTSQETKARSTDGAKRDNASALVAAKAESAADLLLAADKARASGQAKKGAELLRRLLSEHRDDARAPLAAFTLGRMLLMELARPREAAAAFAEARRLAPRGSFAEDALAREIEALSRAELPGLARTRREEYLRLYPDSRRAASLKVMSGIK
jgi:transmembrane sensor